MPPLIVQGKPIETAPTLSAPAVAMDQYNRRLPQEKESMYHPKSIPEKNTCHHNWSNNYEGYIEKYLSVMDQYQSS